VVIGGGFIGSEIAAALNMNHVSVTMVFPDSYLCQRVFPVEMARAMQEQYRQRGEQKAQEVDCRPIALLPCEVQITG
jgi:NADPH-dependent 2,4-dienoyl-CoA reductase/sulfur reductase-like enzyme